ncbi:MAG: hypothetical protein V3V47_05300 [Desulfobacteria bacterium]
MKIDVLPTLQTQRIWVNWKQIQRNGKTTKVPFDSQTHKPAKSNDPATWGSFQEAIDASNDGKAYNGIGVMLSPDDMLVMGDLDGCVVDGVIDAGAQWIIDKLNTYSEISPSGQGVRILFNARMPDKHRCKLVGNKLPEKFEGLKAFEVYHKERFATITAKHLEGTLPTVENRQREIEEVYEAVFGEKLFAPTTNTSNAPEKSVSAFDGSDDELIERARKAKNGKKFIALFDDGDLSGHGGDASAADEALVCHLLFWTGPDHERIDRLFQRSKLCRDKWTNREDYRQRTIDAALEKVKKFYSPPKHKEPSQGERLTRLCEDEAVAIFRNQYNQPHVQLHFDGNYPHDEAVPVRSQRFKQWMARRYREMVGTPPGNDGIKQAQLQMEAICSDKPRRILYNRVGHDDSGAILYDLSDAEHRAIEFTSDGWKARPCPPVFRQHRHQKPQMFPIKGGDAKQIFDFCNIAADNRCLFLTTVCSYLIPNIPHAILLLSGPPGSGKSTITRCIKNLIDPSEISYMSAPKDEQSAEHHFAHHWLVAYDNINRVPGWLSDCLCRAVTGGGSSCRQLYTDGDDIVRAYKLCIVLNAVGNVTNRSDFLDRCVLVEATEIKNPIPETEADRLWQKQKPQILGGLLDAVAAAMASTTSWPGRLPRMADFAVWGVRLAESLGYEPDEFAEAYDRAIVQKWSDAIERDAFAKFVVELVADRGEWVGSSSELLDEIPDRLRNRKYSPQSATAIGRELNQLTPAFLKVGIDCQRTKSGSKRVWSLSRINGLFNENDAGDDTPI